MKEKRSSQREGTIELKKRGKTKEWQNSGDEEHVKPGKCSFVAG